MYDDIIQKQETETILAVLRGQKGWIEMGGPKSGHYRHRGRKGKKGGSTPSKGDYAIWGENRELGIDEWLGSFVTPQEAAAFAEKIKEEWPFLSYEYLGFERNTLYVGGKKVGLLGDPTIDE